MSARLAPVFPISTKKCEIFFGIFALKFCKFRRFFSRQKPAFLFPAKNRRQLRFTAPCSGISHKSRRKVAELGQKTFFFFEITLKSAFSHCVENICTISGIFEGGENLEGTLVSTYI